MATTPAQIKITELDYDQILTNLIDFMKADPTFADYDFTGSGLRMLARVLAYVTFYQNYYVSAAANEAFLDTAQLRSSVASHARMLGYNIHGVRSAKFTTDVAVELSDTTPASISLPKRTQFALAANTNLTFYTLEDVTMTKNIITNQYEATGVDLTEGTPLQYRFLVNLTDPTQRFVIPNANVDVSTLEVRVQQSASVSTETLFTAATDHLVVGPTDPVFFTQETHDGFQELKFGNGVVGLPLAHGNIVIVDYLASRGTAGNGVYGPFRILTANVANFVRGATITDANTVPSMGGSAPEDLDSVRFLAPLVYSAQNRCVTVEDYKSVILSEYGESIAAINVFGGEQGDPSDPLTRPVFGQVFIVLKPKIGLRFTDTIRKQIETTYLKPRCIVGIIPQVIDPDYVYMNVTTSVRYDPRSTTRSSAQLAAAIQANIIDFAESSVEKFDTSFRFSRLVRVIDNTDDAIVSSLTRIDLEKRIYPKLGEANRFVLKFNAPLRRNRDGSAILEESTRRFTYVNNQGVSQDLCFLFEQEGRLHVAYRTPTATLAIFQYDVGTVDVNTGLIVMSNFAPTLIENDEIYLKLRVVPAVNDFTPKLNQLFTIDSDTSVNVQLVNDATTTVSEQSAHFDGGILP